MLTHRPLTRDDVPLLGAWLADPLVARWWHDDPSTEAVERTYGPCVDGTEPCAVFVVELDGVPVGLVQRYRIADHPADARALAAVVDVPAGALGIDYLLGEPTARGRGLGAALVDGFVTRTFDEVPDAQHVLVPVALGNRASWRTLERAGSTRVAEGELEPDDPADPREHVVHLRSRTGEPEPALVARLRAAGCVFAEDEARLLLGAAGSAAELAAMTVRRCAGEPLEVVVGWAELGGQRVLVDPGVFVPRRRSELLAREAVALARPGSVVVDLCCGTGAVAVVVAEAVPGVELHAADVDPAAVRCARRNLEHRGGHVHEGDLDAPLPVHLRGRVDVLVANAPYVPSAEIRLLPAEARAHEPLVALDGGPDGLDVQRRVAAAAPGWLAPGGHVLVETSEHQCPGTVAAMRAAGLEVRVATDDELGATVVVGRWP